MRLYIAAEGGEVLCCPTCERGLLPAYQTEDELTIDIWSDFAPEEGQAGLLVCCNPLCDYEEPITFTRRREDAVVWNADLAYDHFTAVLRADWPPSWCRMAIAEIRQLLEQTGRLKFHDMLIWLERQVEERLECIDRWLAEAEQGGYPVTFQAERQKRKGQILASHGDEFVLQLPGGEVQVLPKAVVWGEHIAYPKKSGPEPDLDELDWENLPILCVLDNPEFIVVEGYHLGYGEPTELGGQYVGRCWDPVAAAALRLSEKEPGYWEGVFRADEIDRYYLRHDYVKIQGHWLQDIARDEEHRLTLVHTEDPAVGEALGMKLEYKPQWVEFGVQDGEVIGYRRIFSWDEIEEARWEEEVQPLPPVHW